LKNTVHVQVFYSPSCPFSFRQLERIRKAIENLRNCIVYEEINIYEKPGTAEKIGFYVLLDRDFVPVFIDGQQYAGDFTQTELGEAVKKALRESK
jgi:hypothetical protein